MTDYKILYSELMEEYLELKEQLDIVLDMIREQHRNKPKQVLIEQTKD